MGSQSKFKVEQSSYTTDYNQIERKLFSFWIKVRLLAFYLWMSTWVCVCVVWSKSAKHFSCNTNTFYSVYPFDARAKDAAFSGFFDVIPLRPHPFVKTRKHPTVWRFFLHRWNYKNIHMNIWCLYIGFPNICWIYTDTHKSLGEK